MDNEEKVVNEATNSEIKPEEAIEAAPVQEEDEDGFTDEALPPVEPAPVEEAAQEEPKVEEEPLPEDAEVVEEPEVELVQNDYDSFIDDERFTNIEKARESWHAKYKKISRIRLVINIFVLLSILAGWLIPTLLMKDAGSTPLFIGLGCAGAGIVILVILGAIVNRRNKQDIAGYFGTYFENVNSYTLGDFGATNIEGVVENKITKEEFLESGAFDAVATIGSRDNVVFNYKGMDCALCEAAAQVDAGKSLATVFVGKYLRAHNVCNLSDEGLIIYFSGNDRALPPAKLKSLHITEKNSRYTVYGAGSDKKVMTKKFREALAKIRTNNLLVDITLVIKPGRTYWYLGYEDDIMVLPNDKPYDPKFLKEYKDQLALVLDATLILNTKAHE